MLRHPTDTHNREIAVRVAYRLSYRVSRLFYIGLIVIKGKGKGKRTCIAPLMKLHLKALRYGSVSYTHLTLPTIYSV